MTSPSFAGVALTPETIALTREHKVRYENRKIHNHESAGP